MKVEFLGIEQVQVAAGEFMASVFEISVTETVPSLAPGQIENEWMTIYMVEKVGMVKMVNVMESLAPVRVGGSAQSDEINALMQEGISAMQRGEDPADLFKRMTELQSSAGVGGLEYQSRKNTIIQELVKYTVD